jgi:hypothetical protein
MGLIHKVLPEILFCAQSLSCPFLSEGSLNTTSHYSNVLLNSPVIEMQFHKLADWAAENNFLIR